MNKVDSTSHIKLEEEEEKGISQPFLKPNYKNVIKKSGKFFWRKDRKLDHGQDRMIITNHPDNDLPNNSIRTSKYTWFTFIPKNLIEQFSKLPNLYFLIVGFLQMIKEITTSNGVPVIFMPLGIVLLISGIKDLIEDLKRHKDDENENQNAILKLNEEGRFQEVSWRSLRVGDIIKIKNDEYIPADVILLSTSESNGSCYLETKNLDGETNLKKKTVPKNLIGYFTSEEDFTKKFLYITYESPNPYLYAFRGSVKLQDKTEVALDSSNFLLRACSLKSDFVIGMVAYTGHDTKIMLNSVKARAKSSRLERIMNKQIIIIFVAQLILCLFCAIVATLWAANHKYAASYLELDDYSLVDRNYLIMFFTKYGNWMLIFTNFVPISLLVTLEMVKFLQGIFISNDKKMYSFVSNTYANVQSSRLNEELGQVAYIFSDKTGTLTCNVMQFRNLCAMSESYGNDRSFDGLNDLPKVTNVSFQDKNYFDALNNPNHENYDNIHECLKLLSLCHTVFTDQRNSALKYHASSPDELALINFAKLSGYEFLGTNEMNNYIVKKENSILTYKILHILEFTSSRKRMSVIFEDHNGDIILYCKGADAVIIDRINIDTNPYIDEINKYLKAYAIDGLRTLLLAKKIIDKEFYKQWNERYSKALTTVQNREEIMEEIQEEIERDMLVIGATGVEDKLQDQVDDTIMALKEAGIKVWVLTGDKPETAINIGYSCRLLERDMSLIMIDTKNLEELRKIITATEDQVLQQLVENPYFKFAIIISGDTLVEIVNPEISKAIFKLFQQAKVVVACRVSPKQKREVVDLVKNYLPNIVTLAIGDGANDVNMLTAAHIGIGIRGLEGYQAARASDYAIGEFRFLRRLLLYYGRESYRKNSNLVSYNFYKNLLLVLPQFWYGFMDGFSGQVLYEPYIFQLYNILFTTLPIIIFAIMDKEYRGAYFEAHPKKYSPGLKDSYFNQRIFWYNILLTTLQAGFIPYICFLCMESSAIDRQGLMLGFWNSGITLYGALIIIVNLKIWIISFSMTIFNIMGVLASIAAFFLSFLVFNHYQFDVLYKEFAKNYGTFNLYAATLLTIFCTNIVDWMIARYSFLNELTEEDTAEIIAIKTKTKRLKNLMSMSSPINIELEDKRIFYTVE